MQQSESHHRKARINHFTIIANASFVNVAMFKHLEATNPNYIQEDVTMTLTWGNSGVPLVTSCEEVDQVVPEKLVTG
jgi:hypothetical protein